MTLSPHITFLYLALASSGPSSAMYDTCILIFLPVLCFHVKSSPSSPQGPCSWDPLLLWTATASGAQGKFLSQLPEPLKGCTGKEPS
ncbi:uncharacterized protein LY79DRAFT_191118 [Colletotrichum navitas]|uniref:Uncharacterized protein n=1 Tax=Colletotrichum navitas TaxID=681940 RepID=A0AAD8Q0Q0_9PEZI|nr:uncharacterized protein LY79DRAFT_191118 [Colletotrichum navitas]KAK1593216.1 hypothetical protein LY79DRAFT_191118 [Colletotrichum navitas]